MTPIVYVGIAWFRQQDYNAALSVMEDATLLPKSFESWLALAEKLFERLENEGRVPIKAYIDPATFPSWCAERGLKVNAHARMQFANFVAKQAQDNRQ